jgi:hypothetical protein
LGEEKGNQNKVMHILTQKISKHVLKSEKKLMDKNKYALRTIICLILENLREFIQGFYTKM